MVVMVGIVHPWGGVGKIALEEREYLPGGDVVEVAGNRLSVGRLGRIVLVNKNVCQEAMWWWRLMDDR